MSLQSITITQSPYYLNSPSVIDDDDDELTQCQSLIVSKQEEIEIEANLQFVQSSDEALTDTSHPKWTKVTLSAPQQQQQHTDNNNVLVDNHKNRPKHVKYSQFTAHYFFIFILWSRK